MCVCVGGGGGQQWYAPMTNWTHSLRMKIKQKQSQGEEKQAYKHFSVHITSE